MYLVDAATPSDWSTADEYYVVCDETTVGLGQLTPDLLSQCDPSLLFLNLLIYLLTSYNLETKTLVTGFQDLSLKSKAKILSSDI